MREEGKEVKWEWKDLRGFKRPCKKFNIRFPNLLSPFHPSVISSTAGSQSVLQWGHLHLLKPCLLLCTLKLTLSLGGHEMVKLVATWWAGLAENDDRLGMSQEEWSVWSMLSFLKGTKFDILFLNSRLCKMVIFANVWPFVQGGARGDR